MRACVRVCVRACVYIRVSVIFVRPNACITSVNRVKTRTFVKEYFNW